MAINQLGYQSREQLIKELQLRLADGIVDVELDRDHYDIAINKAISTYRQLSSGSVEESVVFIQTQPDVTDYTLPDEVMEVRRLFRRGVGTNSGTGSNFDPFDMAFNNMYLLNAGQSGGLATFDAFSQYKETVGRLFGSEYDFTYNRNTKVLKILRNVRVNEEVAVEVYNFVPEHILLSDVYASPWLSNYAMATAKQILGEARSKFATVAGPQGGTSLNGDSLKAEAQQEMDKLEQDLALQVAGGVGYGFLIG